MKNLCRLTVLVGIFAFAVWGATPRFAFASVPCENLQFRACTSPGEQLVCHWTEFSDREGSCRCTTDRKWSCL